MGCAVPGQSMIFRADGDPIGSTINAKVHIRRKERTEENGPRDDARPCRMPQKKPCAGWFPSRHISETVTAPGLFRRKCVRSPVSKPDVDGRNHQILPRWNYVWPKEWATELLDAECRRSRCFWNDPSSVPCERSDNREPATMPFLTFCETAEKKKCPRTSTAGEQT